MERTQPRRAPARTEQVSAGLVAPGRVLFTLIARDSTGRVVARLKVTEDAQSIGRAPEAGLLLPSSGVSRQHATVYLHGDGVVIRDEGSANGVKVDGQLISAPTLIDHTNQIQISSFALSLEPEGVGAPDAEPIAPTDTDDDIDLDTQLEPFSRAGQALAKSRLQIVGRDGPYDKAVFDLSKPLMTVGRADDNDITLEDPSVSRKHAQLRMSVTGDKVTVLDLRSHNGSYVDGERVKRADARLGAVLRFGDLAFKLERVVASVAPRVDRGRGAARRRLIIGLVSVVLAIGAVGVVAYMRRPPPEPVRRLTVEDRVRRLEAEIQSMVDEAKRRIAEREWALGIEQLDKVLRKDPLNKDAKPLRKKALAERTNEKIFEDGLKYFELGNPENLAKARAIFSKVPRSSVYHREVRYKLRTIDERAAEDQRVEGVSRCRGRYWSQCQAALCKFFELVGDQPVAGEAGLRRMLKRAEDRLQHRNDFETCRARRFISPPSAAAVGGDPAELLAERYPSRPVRALVALYIDGKIDLAIKKLIKLRKRSDMRPELALLDDINNRLLIIRGKYQEGYGAYRERRAEEAEKHWRMALSNDEKLVPKGIESFHRREVLRQLGDLYFELGDEAMKATRYRPAFEMFERGKQLNPGHDRLLNGLLQLEAVAERALRDGRTALDTGRVRDARAKLTLARDICQAGRPLRLEAEKALKQLD